jgi:hypothetical protein
MWYKLAQENLAEETFKRSNQKFENKKALRSEIRKDPNGISVTFYSPIINFKNLNDYFYQEYPNVRIYLNKPKDFKNTKLNTNYYVQGFNINPDQVDEILKRILKVFAKYPPGFLPQGSTVEVVSAILPNLINNPKPIPPGAYASFDIERIVINYAFIEAALDHEIGHIIDESHSKKSRNLTQGSPTLYGLTNNDEAYAEGVDILTAHGWNYRLPPTSQENIKINKLLDYIYQEHKRKLQPETEGDFKGHLQDNYRLNRHMPFSIESDTMSNDLDNARFGRIVGAIQHAIDKFKGDKNSYAKALLKDKNKLNQILKYVNGLMFFVNSPATEKEIELAVKTVSLSLDKKKNSDVISIDGNTIRKNTVDDKNIINEKKTSMSKFYLPKKIKEYIDANISQSRNLFEWYAGAELSAKALHKRKDLTLDKMLPFSYEHIEQNPKNSYESLFPISELTKEKLKNIPKVSIYDELVPVDENDYKVGQFVISKSNVTYVNESYQIESLTNNLVKQIFPPLTYNNPEDYLYYDFHIDSTGNYSLNEEAVEQKINYAINTNEFTKNKNETQKKKIAYEIRRRINDIRDNQKYILNRTVNEGDFLEEKYVFPGMMDLFPGGKFSGTASSMNTAKKAVDKLFTLKIPRKNLLFMRIYNNMNLAEKQKQELLNYYKTKQAQVVRK